MYKGLYTKSIYKIVQNILNYFELNQGENTVVAVATDEYFRR